MFDNLVRDPTTFERFGDALGRCCDQLLRVYADPVRVALIEAITAGFALAGAICVFKATDMAHETVLSVTLKIILPTLLSYLAVWFVLSRLAKYGDIIVASWLPISLIGTFLALLVQAVPGLTADWLSSSTAGIGFQEYANKWATIIFTLQTIFLIGLLPLTAIIHYLGWGIRVLRS